MRRSERIALILLAAAALALRVVAFFHYRVDSDEPQHLHVAWGWTAGFVQYRDVFDNHAPLFHMLTAPFLALFGERPDIMLPMRGVMIPLFAVVIVATFVIARRLYSARAGWWAALLLTVFPPFFLKSLEYRTDNLWMALWMLVLLATPHAFLTGFLLGLALTVSLKTTILVASLAGAALVMRRVTARYVAAAAAGFVIAPAAVILFFSRFDALDALRYCVFEFNAKLNETRPTAWLTRLIFPLAAALIVIAARRYRSAARDRMFLALTAAWFVALLVSFWIYISPRDLLPLMPIAATFLAGALVQRERALQWGVPIALASMLSVYYYADRLQNRMDEYITMMNQGLRMTRPGEPIMDLKGEIIYRRRPFYYPFEAITREQMKRGLIRDTIPEDVVNARCYTAQADGPIFPPRGREFLNRNFMDLGRLRAAGQWVQDDGTFTIAIPGAYAIVNADGHARGLLDRRPYTGTRELAAGPHRFENAEKGERIAVIWSKAFERGLSPFHLQDREF